MDHFQFCMANDNYCRTQRNMIGTIRNTSLNPWSQQQLTNPFLYQKSQNQQNSLKKKKILRFRSLKKQQTQVELTSTPLIKLNPQYRLSKQLPRLNIGQFSKNASLKKKKQQSTPNYLITSPLKFISHNSQKSLNRVFEIPFYSHKTKQTGLLPKVSRELSVTSKIFKIQNNINHKQKIQTNTQKDLPKDHQKNNHKDTLNGNHKETHKEYKNTKKEGDIRKLVDKEWAKRFQN